MVGGHEVTIYLRQRTPSVGAEVGLMLPWGPAWSQRTTSICDRFFLGGVGSLRGFCTRSVGPVDARRPQTADAPPPARNESVQ